MAKVDTSEIETVYGSLSQLATNTLQGFIGSFAMTEATKAQVLSTTMTTLIQTSVQVVQEQPVKDAQIAQLNAQIAQATAQTNAIISDQGIKVTQSAKDLLVKDEQIAHFKAQTTSISKETTIKEAQSAKDLLVKEEQIAHSKAQTTSISKETTIKEAQSANDLLVKEEQKILISAQINTEAEKKLLTVRQTSYYNDQCKMEKSKHYSTMTMGALQSGTTVPTDLWTATFTAANNIISS